MKTKLQSGQPYSISDLFSGDNKIIIPDLQRDYTWGDEKHGTDKNIELVSGFCNSLLESFDKIQDVKKEEIDKRELQLGMIYAYENPINHINIADGQQRLTTLFLLIGMLYRKTNNERLKERLMSEFELKDDQEPYLQYAIRESTLYFLSDLVCNFFFDFGSLNKYIENCKEEGDSNKYIKQSKIETSKIKECSWYFSEYDNDPSIKSMIKAIGKIDKVIEETVKDKDVNYLSQFADWLISEVKFLYFDMENRQHGEEMFVVINTTGEALTATENLKPIIIGNIEGDKDREMASNEWEEREEWFWQNKSKKEATSDPALDDFFIWYWQIRLLQEKSWKNKKSYILNSRELFLNKPKTHQENEENPEIERWEESKKTKTIHSYFKSIEKIIELNKNEKEIAKILNTIKDENISLNWFRKVDIGVVLPLITYIEKFKEPKYFHEFVRRIRKNYFDNEWEERKTNYIDWRYIIQIIELSKKEEDVFVFNTKSRASEFRNIKNVTLNEWYNIEEQIKNELKKENKDEIVEWEDHQDFMGDLSFLFSINKNFEELNIENKIECLKKYYDNYINTVDLVRYKYGENKNENDLNKLITSNLFRLFRLYIGCNTVGHIKRVNWGIEGVLFSSINRVHLKKKKFKKLCATDNITVFIDTHIKEKVKKWNLFDIDSNNFSTDKFIKAWLTLKVYYANKEKVHLKYYDGQNSTGVAAYIYKDTNKLFFKFDFCIENSICGFGVRSGFGKGNKVDYTDENLWNNIDIIDTTFAGVEFQDFTLPERDGTQEELDENRKVIDKIKKIIEAD